MVQSWSQETDYTRTAKVTVPATTAGQKVPVVFHLHGNGGQGNTQPVGGWLGDDCIIVAPDGYERSWNVFTEKSKADDVSFILDLIAKIGAEIPAADMDNVNIIGTSNGAALTYRLIIETGADRTFRRAFPMVSSLISPQYHDDQFWASSVSAAPGEANVYDTPVLPMFADSFEYAHFHGTEDGALQYEGQSPGPGFLGGADVIAAQKTDFLWAVAMGYTGAQLADSAGVSIGTSDKPVEEYVYLNGKVRHYKLVGEGHGTGPGHAKVQEIVKAAILG
jgi:poly(3-hydroxybutyrate) depolymerase